MYEVRETSTFRDWLTSLKDRRAVIKIAARIRQTERGNLGDIKPVGEGISEMRIHYGPGYRIYLAKQSGKIVILLCGGTKKTQAKDIKIAKKMTQE